MRFLSFLSLGSMLLVLASCGERIDSTADIVLCEDSSRSSIRRNLLSDKHYGVVEIWIAKKRFETTEVSGEIEIIEHDDYTYIGKPVFIVIPKRGILKDRIAIGDYEYRYVGEDSRENIIYFEGLSTAGKIIYSINSDREVLGLIYDSVDGRQEFIRC